MGSFIHGSIEGCFPISSVLSTVVDSNNGLSLGILLPAGYGLVNWGIANSHRNHAPDYAQHSLGCCLTSSLSLFWSFFDEERQLN